jgi:predicted  nucleic acid-binding Zn-ribbon protein
MTTQVQKLLLLQEIDALLHHLAEGGRETEERLGFPLGSLTGTRTKRTKIAHSVDPEVLERYEQVRKKHLRAVAAQRRGVCLGCFTVRPTRSAQRRHGLEICERCGRILFRLEEPRPATPAARPAGTKRRRAKAAP